MTAAELAKTYGIRVYTIGVGTYGEAPYPVQTPFFMMKSWLTEYQIIELKIKKPIL